MATVDFFFTRLFKGELPNDAASNLPFGSPDVVEMSSRPVHACIPYFRHVPPNLSSLSFEPHCSRHHKAINTIAHLFSQWQNVYCMLLYIYIYITANLTSQLFSAKTGAAPLCFFTQRSAALLPQRRARAEVSQTN